MKLKYLLGIVFVAAVGGFIAYQLLNKKERHNTNPVSDDNTGATLSEEAMEQDNIASNNGKKCDATMHRVYENMSVRNEEAKHILADIHDDMKKAENNIASKKEDIEKIMENLKK